MASVASYGGYTFQDNELNLVTLTVQKQYSPRRRKIQDIKTAHCEGQILASDMATFTSRLNEIENALKNDYGNFTYTIGGTTGHSLLNDSSCVSGTKIIARNFPKGDGAEFATRRTFSFTIQGTYDSVEDDLFSWQETVEVIGTGGPKFVILETVDRPYAMYVSNASVQYFQQTGTAVGYANYPAFPGPNGAGLEFLDRRRETRSSGRQVGNGIRFFPIRWSYMMCRDPQNFGDVTSIPASK